MIPYYWCDDCGVTGFKYWCKDCEDLVQLFNNEGYECDCRSGVQN